MTPEEKERLRPIVYAVVVILLMGFLFCVSLLLDELSDPQCCADYSAVGQNIHECGNCSYIQEKYSKYMVGQGYAYGGEGRIIKINLTNLTYLP
jgi:hypothetical protein